MNVFGLVAFMARLGLRSQRPYGHLRALGSRETEHSDVSFTSEAVHRFPRTRMEVEGRVPPIGDRRYPDLRPFN